MFTPIKLFDFEFEFFIAMSNFITNSDSHQKALLLLGGFNLPFDNASTTITAYSEAT